MTTAMRDVCEEIAEDRARELRGRIFESVDDRLWQMLAMISFSLGDISETDLREFLILAGVDLDDPSERERASDMVSMFVKGSAILLSDQHGDTLNDPDSPLAIRYLVNDDTRSAVDDVRIDGQVFRETKVAALID